MPLLCELVVLQVRIVSVCSFLRAARCSHYYSTFYSDYFGEYYASYFERAALNVDRYWNPLKTAPASAP